MCVVSWVMGGVGAVDEVGADTGESQVDGEEQCGSVGTVVQMPGRIEQLLEALELPSEKLTEEQFRQLRELVGDYSDVFALDDTELGHTDLVQHVIDTGDHPPIKQQPYRVPVVHREKITQMIAEMRKQDVIRPSASPWASPVVLVPKKDGKLRFCIDYRRLNAATRKDVYPLPRIDDILDTLGRVKYFTSLDLASGYWQVGLEEESRQKSAFTTHCGLYEFTRMPFGLCNAPATFQRLMQRVLAGLEWDSCFVYIDDVFVVASTFEEHLERLREVFERLRHASLRLKPKKCLLLRDEVPYLGHVVSCAGIKPDPAKIKQVRLYPVPTDATKVRQFLGLASYYRRFIPDFAKIAHPMHALTKKNAVFEWTADCGVAFNELKERLVTAPVLSHPCFGPDEEFVLETDASGVGLGAILSQIQEGQLHPIAYASRTLDCHERNYGISELETLGLIWAVKHFRPYILGHHTTVYTDHAACTSLLKTARPSGKLARWALAIQEMDLSIKHRSGKKNANADALSRNLADAAVGAVEGGADEEGSRSLEDCSYDVIPHLDGETDGDDSDVLPRPEAVRLAEIKLLQREDSSLAVMCSYLEQGLLPEDEKDAKRLVLESRNYDVIHGVLYYEPPTISGRLCVVVPEKWKQSLLCEAHATSLAGHFAFKKVYDRIRRYYWWKGMRADVHHFCRACLVCASRKGTGKPVKPALTPDTCGRPFPQ